MNPRPAIAAVAVALALLGAGCRAGLPDDVARLDYVDRQHRFAVNLPDGWSRRESADNPFLVVMGPGPDDAVRPSLNVVVLPRQAVGDIDEMVARTRSQLETFAGFEAVSEETRQLAGGHAARVVTFRQDAFEVPLKQRQMYVIAADRAYTVTATAGADTFADNENAFEVCLKSFRVGW